MEQQNEVGINKASKNRGERIMTICIILGSLCGTLLGLVLDSMSHGLGGGMGILMGVIGAAIAIKSIKKK